MNIYIYTYVYIYIHTHTYIYIYIYIYVHPGAPSCLKSRLLGYVLIRYIDIDPEPMI